MLKDKMYKNYSFNKSTSNNKPSISVKDFCIDNELDPNSVRIFLQRDDSISPSFNKGKSNYYHIEELTNWYNSNSEKINNRAQLNKGKS